MQCPTLIWSSVLWKGGVALRHSQCLNPVRLHILQACLAHKAIKYVQMTNENLAETKKET